MFFTTGTFYFSTCAFFFGNCFFLINKKWTWFRDTTMGWEFTFLGLYPIQTAVTDKHLSFCAPHELHLQRCSQRPADLHLFKRGRNWTVYFNEKSKPEPYCKTI